MELEITRMSEKDLDDVHRIETKVFSEPWSRQAFLSDLKNDFAIPLIVRFENKVAGYASLYSAADELQIGNLAVSPDYHKRGIGAKMVEHIINLAAENHKRLLVLEVRPSNEAACKLYAKYGFRIAGKRKYYYHKPTEDALIMIRGIE